MENPQIIYLDTNIIGELASTPEMWSAFQSYLLERNLVVGLGEGQLAELSDARALHQNIARFLATCEAGILMTTEEIIDIEVSSYPVGWNGSPIKTTISAGDIGLITDRLGSAELATSRAIQKSDAEKMSEQLQQGRQNFPRDSNGMYDKSQIELYAWTITLQWLGKSHYDFITQFRERPNDFDASEIRSVYLFALVSFYKYYIWNQEPQGQSDFGDMFHLFVLPYCAVIIVERNICDALRLVQRNHSVLAGVQIENIEFIRGLSDRS